MTAPGTLLRQARRQAGLSQRAVAAAAGVQQPLVSRIETGKEQPGLGTLARLVGACGYRLQVDLEPLVDPHDLTLLETPAMTSETFDPIALLAVLNRHRVRYVVIGGFAATAHGSPLPTTDVDVTPEPTRDNLGRLSGALDDLTARVRVEGIPGGLPFAHSGESLMGITVLHLVTRIGDLDLVLHPAGGTAYADLASRASTVRLHHIEVALASLDDVIASKQAAERPQDRYALATLRALRHRLRDDGRTCSTGG